MPKATDITGTFRVPEEAWGRFWNAMLTIPGADITPNTRVHDSAERKSAMTAKCIILGVLAQNRKKKLTGEWLADLIHEAGKPRGSVPALLKHLQEMKLITGDKRGHSITGAGLTLYKAQCNGGNP